MSARKLRNLLAFWCFGLGNNLSYVIMLSAAVDIIRKQEPTPHLTSRSFMKSSYVNCTQVGTGTVLLADIIPSMTLKFLAPIFIHRIHFHAKVLIAVALALNSYVMVSFSNSLALSLVGVVSASMSSGLGDISFLSMTAFFDKSCVSAWSSGTGAAGLVGSLVYVALTSVTTPEITLLLVTIVPFALVFVYFFVLDRPTHPKFRLRLHNDLAISAQTGLGYIPIAAPNLFNVDTSTIDNPALVVDDQDTISIYSRNDIRQLSDSTIQLAGTTEEYQMINQLHPSGRMKLSLLRGMMGLLVFLALVYFFEYLINQSLFELLYFPNTILSSVEQYRWYQVLYQLGVFISRSSVSFIQFRRTWIMTVLQGINFTLCVFQVKHSYIKSIWIMFALVLYEGLLGGLSYVNTFYRIIQETEPSYREYAMAFATISDSIGIAAAGFVALPLHNWLCFFISG